VKEVYKITSDFPKAELYGLTSQVRRASVSIPTNVVEGFSRKSTKEYLQFLYNSRGSLEEVRYLLLLSQELNYLDENDYKSLEKQCEDVSKMLNGLISSLKGKLG
jgi:four helix bundle protein